LVLAHLRVFAQAFQQMVGKAQQMAEAAEAAHLTAMVVPADTKAAVAAGVVMAVPIALAEAAGFLTEETHRLVQALVAAAAVVRLVLAVVVVFIVVVVEAEIMVVEGVSRQMHRLTQTLLLKAEKTPVQ
jgi:hypothetical protein